MKKIIIFFLFNFLFSHCFGTHTIFIVVHGTWASTSPWCKVEGDFFNELTKSIQSFGYATLSFTWSGKLDAAHRFQAGKDLAQLIESYPQDTCINLITHSHGSNVGIVASQRLINNTINNFYALGTPVNTKLYMPNMERIGYLYNMFSLKDMVQPVFGMFEREYPAHEHIANIRIMLNDYEPMHNQLHDPIIGTWLIHINKDIFERKQPVIAHFCKKGPPIITYDPERKNLIELERLRMEALLVEFCRKR